MQHLSRLVALHAFGALSDIRSSRRKVMFDALGFSKHEIGPSLSLFSDRDRGLLKAAVKQRTWERKMVLKTAPRGGDKPRNRLPWKLLVHNSYRHHHSSSSSSPPPMSQPLRPAHLSRVPVAHLCRPPSVAVGVLGVPRAMVAAREGHNVPMIPADRAVYDLNTAHGIGRSNRRLLTTALGEGASPHGAGHRPVLRGGGARQSATSRLHRHRQSS